MNWRRRSVQALRAALLLACLLLALAHASGVWPLGFVSQLDLVIADARLRASMPRTRDQRIVIVDVDQKSLTEIGRWPWGRDRMAALVDELFDRQGAAVVGFDMLFSEPDRGTGLATLERLAGEEPALRPRMPALRAELDGDARLARALASRAAVLGFYFDTDPASIRSGTLPPSLFDQAALHGRPVAFTRWHGYSASLPRIAAAAPDAGFINSLPDEDGAVRSLPLIAEHAARFYPALALAVFRRYAGSPQVEPGLPEGRLLPRDYSGLESIVLRQGEQQFAIPVDARVGVRIPFRGPSGAGGGSFEYLSASDLLLSRVAPGHLAGKLVLVGSSAPAMFDLRPTPVSEVSPGVEIHANVLSGLLDGRLPVQPDWARGAEVAQVVLVALVLAALLPRLSALVALFVTLGTLVALTSLNAWLYSGHGLALPLASALLLTATLYAGTTIWGHISEGRSRRSLTRLFGSYVPPELVTEMARDPERYDMHAENRVLTIMFCDMRNFTRVSEALSPEDLRALVNRFFSSMTAAIREQRGTLDKYIGDAIMAFWGAPVDDPAHAEHAVRAALAMTQRLRLLNDDLRARRLPEIGLGLGLNTGLVCVGDMGSDIRRSYTVMGDAVNLASRIEALTRHYGVDLLVGQATREAVQDGAMRWLEIDHVKVKGKQQAVTLFTPVAEAVARAPAFEEEMRLWRLALDSHRKQHWEIADSALSELRCRFGESTFSGLYQRYAARNTHYRTTPPPPDWDSVHIFDSK
ncbi:MAG: adenylate/guanylate cyclase domain-containing protein [Rhizobacter sp.]|nr:adenylate/guanylate cyclase domain-containing protein [Rhizobacter sp.]